jgi:hypothetical protein
MFCGLTFKIGATKAGWNAVLLERSNTTTLILHSTEC